MAGLRGTWTCNGRKSGAGPSLVRRRPRGQPVECAADARPAHPPRRPEVRRLVGRRRGPDQAGRAPDRARTRGRERPGRGRVRDGRHHRRAARAGGGASPTTPIRASSTSCSRPASTRARPSLSMALHGLGVPAISLTGPQAGITTDGRYGRARIAGIEPRRVHAELAAGKVVIVAGFQGQSASAAADDEITTLGRGGSDTTAVALAASLGADALPDLHRRQGHLHRRSAAGRPRSPAAGHRLRGDARARPPGRPGHAGPGRRARLGQRRRHRGPQLVRGRPRHADQGGSARGAAQQGPRAGARPERRQGHHRRGAGPAGRRAVDLRPARRGRHQRRHDRPERRPRRRRPTCRSRSRGSSWRPPRRRSSRSSASSTRAS